MDRRDENNKQPGPVLVTITRVVLKDNMLCYKGKLSSYKGMEKIFINADESIEIRRAKSFLRKAAYDAKQQGDDMVFRHNRISINGTVYTTENVEIIPSKYLPEINRPHQPAQAQAIDMETAKPASSSKEGLIRPGEK